MHKKIIELTALAENLLASCFLLGSGPNTHAG